MRETSTYTEALAAELRRRLGERRRAEAAAGRAGQTSLEEDVLALVEREAAILPQERRAEVAELILRDAIGLGPLEELLGDPDVEDVLVNAPDDVYVERRGRVQRVDVHFDSEQELRDTIERILAPLGRRVDELSPMADARLGDGSGSTSSCRRWPSTRQSSRSAGSPASVPTWSAWSSSEPFPRRRTRSWPTPFASAAAC